MKRSIKSLVGYAMRETDGELGRVDEFFFDDQTWTIRYLVVQTGNWFSGKKVLISPKVVLEPDWEKAEFPVKLTRDQIENSPDIDTDQPVSRQQEMELSNYYPWEGYWGTDPDDHGAGIFGRMPGDLYEDKITEAERQEEVVEKGDQHLRSTRQVTGYVIHAADGEIGKVVDYIIDDRTWAMEFLVINTGTWLNSTKVLLSTKWIKDVNWENSLVITDISREEVKNSPEYDPAEPVNEVYANQLFDYYGRPRE